jgi:hypothetical protein
LDLIINVLLAELLVPRYFSPTDQSWRSAAAIVRVSCKLKQQALILTLFLHPSPMPAAPSKSSASAPR